MPVQPSPDTPENWDAASSGYAERIAPVMIEAYATALIDRLEVDEGCEAVEVGAGSGALTHVLASRVKSLLATDFSPKMIEFLRKRMEAANVANVTCQVMDGQALDLSDASFDRAASSFAMMLFPDRAKGFAELRRVLRPGGRAVVSGWTGPERFEIFGLFLAAMKQALPDLPPPDSPPPVFSLSNPDAFRDEMEAAGFTDVEVDFVSRDVELENFDQLWGMCTSAASPIKMLLDKIGPDGTIRLEKTMRSIVEQRFGSGPIRLTNVATVGRGRAQ